jgi:predicted acetyltransferase
VQLVWPSRENLGRAEGLRYVDVVTGPDNPASERVIERNGGVLVEEFVTLPSLGNKSQLRYRVHLAGG